MDRTKNTALELLQNEVDALLLANKAIEKSMLDEAEHADTMLSELEIQRNSLRQAHKTQQHLSGFIQRVMDSAGNMLIVLSPVGHIVMTNRRCEETLGMRSNHFHGEILDTWMLPSECDAMRFQLPELPWVVKSVLFEQISHCGSYQAEHRLRCVGGTYRHFLMEGVVLHNPQGKLEGAVVSATDITEIKQQEEKLRRSESLLKEAQQHAHLGSWELDLANKKLSWSEEAYRIFEVDKNKSVDPYKDFFASIHPQDRAGVENGFALSLRNKSPLDFVHRLLMPDGREKWVHQRGSHSFGSNGRPKRSVGTVQDITERHYSEQQLRVAATAFESQEGMVVTDRNNVILRVNRSFTNITGYTPEEAVGNTPRLLASGQHGADFYSALWQQLDQTGSWQGEIWNRRKSGEIYPEWLTITTVKDDSGVVTNYVGTMTDITRRKLAEDEIKSLAFFDPLTRLPNRRLLIDRLQQAFATSGRSGRWGALLFLDLDHFKNLNDTLGHDIGDLLLQQVAQRLTECVREGDTVARLGGDEFVVMLEGLSQDEAEAATQTGTLGQKIVASLNQPFHLGKHVHHSTPSIGATQFNAHNCTVDELLKQSDLAMYKAKTSGRNALCFFDPQMQAVVTARASMEAKIRKAVSENQFVLYYQPQILARFNVVGAEGLVRWKDPDRGIVPPSEFISLAEESGLILPIGLWVLRAACEQLAIWATIPRSRHLTISVNVSARQLYQQDFVHEVLAVIKSAGANPNLLKLELTESLLVSNVEETIEKMLLLKGHGVRFALDDFGTGFSSLAYLKRLPLDQLKIDQSFVRDILTDPNDAAIAKTVIALAGSLGLSVIAEGVETESQRGLLEAQGCDSYQGYLFGRPMPIAEFEVLLGQRSLQKDN